MSLGAKPLRKRPLDEMNQREAKMQKMEGHGYCIENDDDANFPTSSSIEPNNFSTNLKQLNGHDSSKRKMNIKNFKSIQKTVTSESKKEEDHIKEWPVIYESIEAILNNKTTSTTLENLFLYVRSACDNNHARDMYDRIIAIAYEFSRDMKKSLDEKDHIPISEDNCKEYIKRFWKVWNVYPVKMILIRNVFLHLDRTMLICAGEADVIPIWEATMQVFRTVFFPTIEKEFKSIRLFLALFCNLQRILEGRDTQSHSIRDLISMCSTVQVSDIFLEFFLIKLREYYNAKRDALMIELSCNDYMKFANSQFERYTNIVKWHFYDPIALKTVCTTILDTLVTKSVPEILTRGFDELIEGDINDIKCMFELCSKVPSGEDHVRNHFTNYIKAKGSKLMDSCPDGELFHELVTFKKKLDLVLWKGFAEASDFTKFRQSMSDAFEYFMNRNGNRAAEQIARYFHSLLRSCNKKATDDNLDKLIDDAIVIFRYIRGKDMFTAFYRRDLAKRLLLERSASVDAEKAVLLKLKEECGAGFTHRLEGMFKDMETSDDLNRLFLQHQEHLNKKKVNISVRVLTSDNWPTYNIYEINLPKEMRESLIDFGQFYKTQHGNRNVSWHFSLSTAVLNARFRPGYTKELNAPLFHAVVLQLFNNSEKWTVKDIVNATKMDKMEVVRTVLSLLGGRGKPRILKKVMEGENAKKDSNMETVEQDSFVVNTEFEDKLHRIRIAQVLLKPTKEENEKDEAEVTQDRQYQIDAAIVRIMKSRKELMHSMLIQEIMSQLRFPVKASDIKTRIASLIERDYICRDSDEPNKYKYVA